MPDDSRDAVEHGSGYDALARFLADGRELIMSEWEAAVRRLPSAARLSSGALRDSLPNVLDEIAQHLENAPHAAQHFYPNEADQHALDRLKEGFDLTAVVQELSLLRDCVLRLWEPDPIGESELDAQRTFSRAIDHVVTVSARRFSQTHERTIRILDRISTAALRARSLDELLESLTTEFREETPAADLTTVFLREGDLLRVRAASGLEASAIGFTVGIGQGFAGKVAADGRALEISSAATEPTIRSEIIRDRGVKALHGVPLVDAGELLGVACMGSLTQDSFSGQDKTLFAAMASRAAAGIAHQLTREAAEQLHADTRHAVHLRDRVLGIVSHDLRNPLATIDLGATLLTTNPHVRDDRMARDQVEIIHRSVRRASRMIEDLLDMSSIQAGRLAITREEWPLEPVLGEAVDTQRALAHAKDIFLLEELDVGAARVLGDRDRLLQVLENLIGNALKFCKSGDTVTVHAEADANEARIAVIDTGPGIPAEDLERIFDPYVRAGRTEQGTGLGLFISKGIVDAHGGRIWAVSELGRGTKVAVVLPLGHRPPAS